MNRKTLFLISLLLSGCLGSFSQTPQQWRDSLAVLNKQISITPYSSDLYLRKAAVNIELQQWDYALDTYNEILDCAEDVAEQFLDDYDCNIPENDEFDFIIWDKMRQLCKAKEAVDAK